MINVDILYGLSLARLKVRYRGSITGLLWVLFQPVTLYLVQLIVFRNVLPVQVREYSFFLATGFLPWFFIQQSILMGTGTFLTYSKSIQSLTVHPVHYLASVIVDTVISFILSFSVILTFLYVWYGGFNFLSAIQMLIACAPLILGTFFFVWICAISQVFFRDTAFIMSFVLHILFIVSPIFYSLDLLPKSFRFWLAFNPISLFLDPFRDTIMHSPSNQFLRSIFVSFTLSISIGVLALLLWRNLRHALTAKL